MEWGKRVVQVGGVEITRGRLLIGLLGLVLLLAVFTPLVEVHFHTAEAKLVNEAGTQEYQLTVVDSGGSTLAQSQARIEEGEALTAGPIVDGGRYTAIARGSSGAQCRISGEIQPVDGGVDVMGGRSSDGCELTYDTGPTTVQVLGKTVFTF